MMDNLRADVPVVLGVAAAGALLVPLLAALSRPLRACEPVLRRRALRAQAQALAALR